MDTDGAFVCDTLDEIVIDRDRLDDIVTEGVTDGIQIFAAKKYAQRGLCVT